MIENLNTLSFNNYGKVIHEGFIKACELIGSESLNSEKVFVSSKNVETLSYVPDSTIAVDIVEGVALLYVSFVDDGSDGRIFLLDKTILINPGVYYSVISLYGKCNIKLSYSQNAEIACKSIFPITGPLGIYPKVDINKVHTLFYQDKEKGFTFKGEKHAFWELTYIDKGVMYTTVDGNEYVLSQGETIFYNTDQFHSQRSEIGSSISFVTITFDMDFDESSMLVNKKFSVDQEMRELIGKIIYEKEQNSLYSDDLIICYLKEFIIKLVRNEKLENTILHQDSVVKNKIENSIISKCIDYVENNIGTKISVPSIARSIPISQSYLSAIFKKHMDMTLVDYISHYRLEKSKDLIKSTEYNFTQISEILGYTSVHYFSNQFKQKYGVSPSEYSRAIKR